MPLVIIITRALGIESAKAPTKAASRTYEMKKNSFSIGVIHCGACISPSSEIAAISSSLPASDEQNCAAITRKKPRETTAAGAGVGIKNGGGGQAGRRASL